MKFVDTVGASIVYINMIKFLNLLNSLKEYKAILEAILDKWIAREVDLELMYLSHEETGVDVTFKSNCELVKGMSRLAEERVNLERKANLYRKEYADQKFELFPRGFIGTNKLKDNEVWLGELGHKLSQRINEIINSDDRSLFIQIIEEIEKIKSHFGFLEKEVKKLKNTWKRLNKLKKKIVSFSWPSDDTFIEWEDKYVMKGAEAQKESTDTPIVGDLEAIGSG